MAQLPPSRLPNFRNLGVLLRALVLVQLLRLVFGWVQAPGWQAWWHGLLDAAPLYEPVTLTVVLLLGAVALTACLVPAVRAARVNPVVALRSR